LETLFWPTYCTQEVTETKRKKGVSLGPLNFTPGPLHT
jgi:hypothetical protein